MKNFRDSAGKWLAVGLVLAGLSYWASPYVAALRFVRAATQNDTSALLERLDVPRLRNSFARQIVRAYPVDPPLVAGLDPVARQAASLIAVTYVDAIIADHFTPDAILRVIANRREIGAMGGGRALSLPPMRNVGSAWEMFTVSGFTGPVSFAVDVEAETGGSYRLGFRLIGGTWRLVSVGLPSEVIARAVDLLKARSAAR